MIEMQVAYSSARRWKLGHQVFHIQLVVMKTLLEDTARYLRAGRVSDFSRTMRALCAIFDASTSTMAYASHFPVEYYSRLIRPSMAPPFVSPGFSGLLNREHHAMLAAFKELWAAAVEELGHEREHWPAEIRERFAALNAAVQRNRENHGKVCERFVPGGVSLLNEFFQERRSEAGSGWPLS